tara:strand:- start:301 stop:879 length:579 start_codon:yes stop_codon:yes gene_type:complete
MKNIIKNSFQDSINTKKLFLEDDDLIESISNTAQEIIECLNNKGTIFFAGNGGSFADSQHITAEFTSRFLFDRDSLPAIALGTNSSSMSAIANDYGYEKIFSREISSLGSLNDIFIPITTSGNSLNLIHAAKEAQRKNLKVVALTGESGGKLASICNCIKVPSSKVPRIQECHILIGHILCQIVEEELFKVK